MDKEIEVKKKREKKLALSIIKTALFSLGMMVMLALITLRCSSVGRVYNCVFYLSRDTLVFKELDFPFLSKFHKATFEDTNLVNVTYLS